MAAIHLRRSLHFVPGANDKMFLKSLASSADSLILDLEDAVTPQKKDEARQERRRKLKRRRYLRHHFIPTTIILGSP